MREGKCDTCGVGIKFFSIERCTPDLNHTTAVMRDMGLTKNQPEPSPSFDPVLGKRYGVR